MSTHWSNSPRRSFRHRHFMEGDAYLGLPRSKTKHDTDTTPQTKKLRLPAEVPNGSRLPCRAGASRLLAPCGPSPATPLQLSPDFYLDHTPSPQPMPFARHGGNHPARGNGPSPISDKRRVGGQVARRSSRQTYRGPLVALASSDVCANDDRRRFLRAERGSTRLPTRESVLRFGSFDLA